MVVKFLCREFNIHPSLPTACCTTKKAKLPAKIYRHCGTYIHYPEALSTNQKMSTIYSVSYRERAGVSRLGLALRFEMNNTRCFPSDPCFCVFDAVVKGRRSPSDPLRVGQVEANSWRPAEPGPSRARRRLSGLLNKRRPLIGQRQPRKGRGTTDIIGTGPPSTVRSGRKAEQAYARFGTGLSGSRVDDDFDILNSLPPFDYPLALSALFPRK